MSLFFGYTACLAVSLATLCVLTKDQTRAPSVKVLSPNHWITREFRNNSFFFFLRNIYGCVGSLSLLSLVAASRAFSLQWLLLLQSMGSRALGPQWLQHVSSAVVVHRLSRSPACGIFSDQGSSLGPMHWQADSEPRDHEESPTTPFLMSRIHSRIIPYI